jgi:hypothetical protein
MRAFILGGFDLAVGQALMMIDGKILRCLNRRYQCLARRRCCGWNRCGYVSFSNMSRNFDRRRYRFGFSRLGYRRYCELGGLEGRELRQLVIDRLKQRRGKWLVLIFFNLEMEWLFGGGYEARFRFCGSPPHNGRIEALLKHLACTGLDDSLAPHELRAMGLFVKVCLNPIGLFLREQARLRMGVGQTQSSATCQHFFNWQSPIISEGLYPLSRHLSYTIRLRLR